MNMTRAYGAGAATLRRAAGRTFGASRRRSVLSAVRAEDGNSTIEFVLILPVFLLIFMLSFETSMIMSRQVMLERGMDLSGREIRLDSANLKTQDQLRQDICARARILPDCMENMRLQLQEIDRATYAIPAISDACPTVDGTVSADDGDFEGARANKIILLRACYSVEPVLARFGLGGDFLNPPDGRMYIVSATAVMVEPT